MTRLFGSIKSTGACSAFMAALVLLTSPVIAGELPERWNNGEIMIGGYLAAFDSEARADSDQLGRGTTLDLENRLNLEEDLASFRGDAYWRFFPRHRIELSLYDISREGNRSISRNIQFGDRVFTAGASVQTDIDFTVFKAAYAYSVVQTERWDGALSIGMFGADISTELSGQILGFGFGTESKDFFAPLPVIGGRLWYAISDDFTLKLDVDFFTLEFYDYEGTLIDTKVALDYDLTDRFGLSLAYNYVSFDLDKTGGSFTGSVDYQYDAIILSGRVMF